MCGAETAWKVEGAVDSPGWSWCWNGRLKKSPLSSHRAWGAVGSFHKHVEAWREQQGPWEEEDYGGPWMDSVNL